jgi:hypothetical protein
MSKAGKHACTQKSSRKPPAIKNEVIARRVLGQTKTRIAKDLGIAINTASSIIDLSGVDRMLDSARLGCAGLAQKAVTVVDEKLDKKSESAAFRLLEGVGVLGGKESGGGTTNISYSFTVYKGRDDAP